MHMTLVVTVPTAAVSQGLELHRRLTHWTLFSPALFQPLGKGLQDGKEGFITKCV